MKIVEGFVSRYFLLGFVIMISFFIPPAAVFADDPDDVSDTGGVYLSPPEVDNPLFTGSANYSYPIEVPPSRMTPKIGLTYNSQRRSNWVGKGWALDMGYIQKSPKKSADFVALINGSTVELVGRPEWGTNYYGARIEGAFSKYYYNTSTGAWEVTAKDGTKYYFGRSAIFKQRPTRLTSAQVLV
jgi:hypothetical protein